MICTLIVADSDRARHQAPALEAQASRLAPRPHKSSGKTSKGPQSLRLSPKEAPASVK
ncbi:hypothetical protein BJF96_g7002 [Verticillium dahliae]|uniref:Uncharacterized protein n=1 Tax=Verticillium dahliae TaxID=27337 RepID=A0AA44WDI4_VERDA|nr:hypothetical protein BJF96_g7002 [Verticillium dahliae]